MFCIHFNDLLNSEEKDKLIDDILNQCISDLDTKPHIPIKLDELIELGKFHKNYKRLAGIIMRESIKIIKNKYKEIINADKKIVEKQIFPPGIFNEKYKKILDEISSDYNEIGDQNFRMNIVYLRKLENFQ